MRVSSGTPGSFGVRGLQAGTTSLEAEHPQVGLVDSASLSESIPGKGKGRGRADHPIHSGNFDSGSGGC